jgi:hypothetical protein
MQKTHDLAQEGPVI